MAMGLTKKQTAMVAVLLAGTFMAVLNATLLTPALPTIMADMQVASTTVQWLTSGYSLTEAVVIPLAAFLMGRLSTRKLYIGGIALFGVGSVVAALAPNFGVLLAGRIIQAACTGAVMPMVMSTILLVFPREKRGSAMGVIGLLIGFAPAIGPTLSGVLIDTIGWRAIFGLVAVLVFIVVGIACAVLENNQNFKPSKFDALSVVLSTLGLVSLLYGLSSFSSMENHLITVALVGVGLVLMGVYAYRQLHLDEPMLRVGILKTGKYRTVVIIVMVFMAALIGMETIMPMYIQGVLGQPATVSGMALLPGALIGAVVGLFAGRIFDNYGVRRPVLVGAAVITVAAIGFTQLRVDSPVWFVSLVYAVMAIGMQFTMTPLNTWGVNSLPNEDVPHAQSTSNTLNQVAGSLGVAVLVSISSAVSGMAQGVEGAAKTFAGYHASFSATAALAIVAVAIILVFVRDKKKAGSGELSPVAGASSAAAACAFTVPAPGSVLVSAAMNPAAVTVRASANMGEVVRAMSAADTSGVSVVDDAGKLVGIVTDGDVARYLARYDMDISSMSAHFSARIQDAESFQERLAALAKLNVMELATKHVVTVDADEPLEQACKVLSERKIKKVPVVRDGVLVGALSRRNVMRYMLGTMETA